MIQLGVHVAKNPSSSGGVWGGGGAAAFHGDQWLPTLLQRNMMLKMQEAKTLDLLVMLGMLAGHAGDVANDANDIDVLA